MILAPTEKRERSSKPKKLFFYFIFLNTHKHSRNIDFYTKREPYIKQSQSLIKKHKKKHFQLIVFCLFNKKKT